jgi:hypothetical protein
MEKLTTFVQDFEKFMAFVKQSDRISDEYIKDFEKIFSVTKETLLLREIQDIKDELNMLTAVFQDQLGILKKAGKDIALDRKKLPQTRSSAFSFQQQTEKHARHVERMHIQASQAYDTVSHPPLGLKDANLSFISAQGSSESQTATGKRS